MAKQKKLHIFINLRKRNTHELQSSKGKYRTILEAALQKYSYKYMF